MVVLVDDNDDDGAREFDLIPSILFLGLVCVAKNPGDNELSSGGSQNQTIYMWSDDK